MTAPAVTELDWFAVTDLGRGIWAIAEPGHVNSFLVVGGHTALLFDSGMGIADIGAIVTGITDLPLLVVNSHSHYDHRGGNASLAARASDLCAHRSGLGRYGPVDRDFLNAYAEVAGRSYDTFTRLREADATSFYCLTRSMWMRPLPDLSDWQVPGCEPTRLIDDGDVLDLGGRQLQVLHTPGHAPDSICLLESATRTLLCGDTVLAGTFWAHLDDADVPVFATTLQRLAALPIDRALVAHSMRLSVAPEHVMAVAAAFAAIAAGTPLTVPYAEIDPFGNPMDRHDFDEFAIFTAPGAVRR